MKNAQSDPIRELYDFATFDGSSVNEDMPDIIEYLRKGNNDQRELAAKTLVEVAVDAPDLIVPHIQLILKEIGDQHIGQGDLARAVGLTAIDLPKKTLDYHADTIFDIIQSADDSQTRAWLLEALSHAPDLDEDKKQKLSSIAIECLESTSGRSRSMCVRYLNNVLVNDTNELLNFKQELCALSETDAQIASGEAAKILAKAGNLQPEKIDFNRLSEAVLNQIESRSEEVRTAAIESASLIVVRRPELWSQFERGILVGLADEDHSVRSQAGRAIINIGRHHPEIIPNGDKISERLRELDNKFNYEEEYGEEFDNLLTLLSNLDTGGDE